ncbi:MAG TPA: hypothetical protein VGT79_07970, partial [Xanthomonadaceae bacterium]|nr:hypothetical protein [Xanthomonadaceae bacterium]
FLALRVTEQPELAEPVAFWTEAQTLSHDGLAERLATAPRPSAPADDAEASPPPRKRPRRRRRHTSASDSGTPDTKP